MSAESESARVGRRAERQQRRRRTSVDDERRGDRAAADDGPVPVVDARDRRSARQDCADSARNRG